MWALILFIQINRMLQNEYIFFWSFLAFSTAYFVPILIAISCAMAAPTEQAQFSQGLSLFSTELYQVIASFGVSHHKA